MINNKIWKEIYKVLEFESIDSTSLEAERMIRSGKAIECIILAKQQTHGKGRGDRIWHSPEGNLYFTILLKHNSELKDIPQFTFIASLSMHQALTDITQQKHNFQLKWPNDILLQDRKLSGILLEISNIPGKGISPWLSIGVGVNISSSPRGLKYPVTSLNEDGISKTELLDKFMQYFVGSANLCKKDGFMAIKSKWLERAWKLGEKLSYRISNNEIVSGVFIDLNDDGAMLLKGDEDCIYKIYSGEKL